MASVKTITLPDGSSYDFKATYDIEGNNISETYINKNEKGAASGVAPLNSSGKIDEKYLPLSGFVSDSGSIVSFEYGMEGTPFSRLVVNIEPLQLGSGDPSPTNIRNIIGWTKATIVNHGQNLMPTMVSGRSLNYNTGENAGTASDGISINCASEEFIPVNLKLSDYVFGYDRSGLPAIPRSQLYCYDQDKNYLGNIVSGTSNPRTFGMDSEHATGTFDNAEVCYIKVRCYFESGSGNTWTQAMCDGAHFRMNPGSTLNDYVAHEAPDIYTSDFTSAGTVYGGELDVLNGKLTVTHEAITFNSSSGWQYRGSNYAGLFSYANAPSYNKSSDISEYMANIYTPYYVTGLGSANYYEFSIFSGADYNVFYLKPENGTITSLSALDTFLSSNPLTVYYPLANPVSYQLTATQVTTLLGQNNVWCDAGDIEVEVIPNEIINYIKSNALVVSQDSTSGELTLS